MRFGRTMETNQNIPRTHCTSSRKRGKGPYYQSALRQLGGFEDKLGDMEKSLKHYELRLTGNTYFSNNSNNNSFLRNFHL